MNSVFCDFYFRIKPFIQKDGKNRIVQLKMFTNMLREVLIRCKRTLSLLENVLFSYLIKVVFQRLYYAVKIIFAICMKTFCMVFYSKSSMDICPSRIFSSIHHLNTSCSFRHTVFAPDSHSLCSIILKAFKYICLYLGNTENSKYRFRPAIGQPMQPILVNPRS